MYYIKYNHYVPISRTVHTFTALIILSRLHFHGIDNAIIMKFVMITINVEIILSLRQESMSLQRSG